MFSGSFPAFFVFYILLYCVKFLFFPAPYKETSFFPPALLNTSSMCKTGAVRPLLGIKKAAHIPGSISALTTKRQDNAPPPHYVQIFTYL